MLLAIERPHPIFVFKKKYQSVNIRPNIVPKINLAFDCLYSGEFDFSVVMPAAPKTTNTIEQIIKKSVMYSFILHQNAAALSRLPICNKQR